MSILVEIGKNCGPLQEIKAHAAAVHQGMLEVG